MDYIKASDKQKKLCLDLIEKIIKGDIEHFGDSDIIKPNMEYINDCGSVRLQTYIKDLFAFLDLRCCSYSSIKRGVIYKEKKKLF